MDLAGWQPAKAGCSRRVGLQPPRRPLEAGRWQLQLALQLLEGQADWKQQVKRLARLARPARLVPVRRRPVLVRRGLALVRRRLAPALVLARVVRRRPVLALVLQLVLVQLRPELALRLARPVLVLQLALALQLVWAP